MTEETKPAPESGYGKEAVRLAELRLVEQTLSSGVQEKKAILISTICFLFVGYLLAFPVEKEVLYKICCWAPPQWSVVFLIKILPSLFFIKPLYHSINVLDLKSYGHSGASPKYTTDDYFKGDLDKLRKELLKTYDKDIRKNAAGLDANSEEMKKAKNWLFFAMVFAGIFVIFRELISVL